MNNSRHLQAVLWSFVGLDRPQDTSMMDRSSKSPVMPRGITCAALVVDALLGLASYAVSALTPVT